MYPFTQEIVHPMETIEASTSACPRWKQDGRRFPAPAYESHNLVWHEHRWRTLSSEELAVLHGIPCSMVKSRCLDDRCRGQDAEGVAIGAIANGYHIPSIMFVVMLLLQAIPQSSASKATLLLGSPTGITREELQLRRRVRGTVFDQHVLSTVPGILHPVDFVDGLQEIFKDVHAEGAQRHRIPWIEVAKRLSRVRDQLFSMQVYWAYRRQHGWIGVALGPTWSTQRQMAGSCAAMGLQRASAASKRGLDHLLPAGLGPAVHIQRAQHLDSPFAADVGADEDVLFAAFAVAVWGPRIGAWRHSQSESLLAVEQAVAPLAEALRSMMPPTVKQVAARKNPALIAVIILALRWPDRRLPLEYVVGHRLIGHIESSNLLRPIEQQKVEPDDLAEGFFGPSAERYLAGLLARKPGKDAADVERLLSEEYKKGYQSSPKSAIEMNLKYGVGGWRPMPLFIHEEAGGKQRLIANGKGGGHNAATSEEETLYVISTTFVLEAATACVNAVLMHFCGLTQSQIDALTPASASSLLPEWMDFGLGCEDMVDAFRQSPVAPCHQGANVVGFYSWSAQAWRFVEVYGLVYGMRSCVVNFSRFPTLGAAAARRIGAALTGPYVDDFTVVDIVGAEGSGQKFTLEVLGCMGAILSTAKHTGFRSQRVMLGVHVRMDAAISEDRAVFEPKVDTVEKVMQLSHEHLRSNRMTPAEASKLRGVSGWCASNTFGRAGRLGLAQLKRRQYSKDLADCALDLPLRLGLVFLVQILPALGPREAHLVGKPGKPVLVYSDASWPTCMQADEIMHAMEPPRLGWVVFPPGKQPRGFTMKLNNEFLQLLIVRRTQIFAAEAIVPLLASLLTPQFFRGQDVLWFIDNEGAVSSLIRGSSKAEDVGHIAAAAQIHFLHLQARVWYEWIDTVSNPADGLSRAGLADCWTAQQGWTLAEISPSEIEKVSTFLKSAAAQQFLCIEAGAT